MAEAKGSALNLSESVTEIIFNRLHITSSDEALDRSFKELSVESDVSREKVKLYGWRNRGSVRLGAEKYRTVEEYNEYVDRVNSIELP